jgi:hypothetical protein
MLAAVPVLAFDWLSRGARAQQSGFEAGILPDGPDRDGDGSTGMCVIACRGESNVCPFCVVRRPGSTGPGIVERRGSEGRSACWQRMPQMPVRMN